MENTVRLQTVREHEVKGQNIPDYFQNHLSWVLLMLNRLKEITLFKIKFPLNARGVSYIILLHCKEVNYKSKFRHLCHWRWEARKHNYGRAFRSSTRGWIDSTYSLHKNCREGSAIPSLHTLFQKALASQSQFASEMWQMQTHHGSCQL